MAANTIYHYEQEKIKELLIGKTVKKISDTDLELSDGTVIELEGNDGCGGCTSGWYQLSYLNECPDNMITNVLFGHEVKDNNQYEPDQSYTIFVLASDERLMRLAEFNGNDGNGYYSTGFHIRIKS